MATDTSLVEGRRRSLTRPVASAGGSALAAVRSAGPVGQVIRFAWHFAQMAVLMMLGMLPLGFVLSAVGQSTLDTRSPEPYALAMTAMMALPMAAFMLLRGHGWERTAEMCGAMAASTVVAAAASLLGLLPPAAALSGPVGALMWAGMLGAMLVRWREYAGHHGHHTRAGDLAASAES